MFKRHLTELKALLKLALELEFRLGEFNLYAFLDFKLLGELLERVSCGLDAHNIGIRRGIVVSEVVEQRLVVLRDFLGKFLCLDGQCCRSKRYDGRYDFRLNLLFLGSGLFNRRRLNRSNFLNGNFLLNSHRLNRGDFLNRSGFCNR